MKSASSKLARSRSQFISSVLVPVRHTEGDLCFGFRDTLFAITLIFGTVGLMRLALGVLGSGLPVH